MLNDNMWQVSCRDSIPNRFVNTIFAKGIVSQVLIIDDEDLVVGLLTAIFTRLGYGVRTANGGKKGIELFNSTHKFDLVITDITMPGMDGNAVARSIRSSDKADVPIIAMSGYDDHADTELFNVSLQKPFNVQSFTEMIKSIEGGPKVV
jgi:two-component system cell cycle sensor histidine kinase/response regulator CckA